MSEDDDRLAERLRSLAASAERSAPGFDPARIVATAHRRRPWTAVAAAVRSPRLPARPAFAVASIVALLAVAAVVLLAVVNAGHGPQQAGRSTTSQPSLPATSGPTGLPTTTTGVPPSTTLRPTTTTAVGTSTTTPPTSTTTTTTTPTSYSYSVDWQGTTVAVDEVRNVDMAGVHDARLVGRATDFQSDDPRVAALVGQTLEVWSAPAEYPGELVVDNSEQSSQSEKDTWIFPV